MDRVTSAKTTFDITPKMRAILFAGGVGLSALVLYGLARSLLGIAPPTPWVRDTALLIHLITVIPAIPLGVIIFLTQKGAARHKLLGKIWLMLMGVTAIATLFIRNIESGGFSWLHIFSVMTLIAIPKAITTARSGRIAQHKSHMLGLFIGALLIAGSFSFLPGRTMWLWAFG